MLCAVSGLKYDVTPPNGPTFVTSINEPLVTSFNFPLHSGQLILFLLISSVSCSLLTPSVGIFSASSTMWSALNAFLHLSHSVIGSVNLVA